MKNEIPSGNKEINDISYRIEKSEEKPVINEKNAKNILNTNENYQNNNLKKKKFFEIYYNYFIMCNRFSYNRNNYIFCFTFIEKWGKSRK